MNNILIIAIILSILGGAVFYIVSQKKKGKKCIGCPCSKSCNKDCH